jgi:nucleotide-binding universal stress UspA family protein
MNLTTPSIRHILAPHDFSEVAEYALTYALFLAEKVGARVTLLHVYDDSPYGYPDARMTRDEFEMAVKESAACSLDAIQARARGLNIDVDASLRRGRPWEQIVAVAAETRADLIVMGTHGRRGVARALIGSVAEKVVRMAACPVLAVHFPASDHERAVVAERP